MKTVFLYQPRFDRFCKAIGGPVIEAQNNVLREPLLKKEVEKSNESLSKQEDE